MQELTKNRKFETTAMSVFTNASGSSREETFAYVRAVLDLLGGRDALEVLAETPAALHDRLAGMSSAAVLRPEAPGKWSVRHVIVHLADSEVVWGWRLRLILAQDRPAIGGYDQDRWAARLGYDETDAGEALERFTVLRRDHLRLLRRASHEDLQRVGIHAERGEESVAHLIRLYAGHDLLHLRQIDRVRAAAASR